MEKMVRRSDFRRVFDSGRQVVGAPAVVYTAPNGLACSRLGVVVSSRAGGAVARNRIRRRLREWARRSWERVRPGWDVILVGRRTAREMPFRELAEELERLFQAAELWRSKRDGEA
ncbi:MAG: ribonuclease P protein component [Clostridia bacterium]|nr:ribonuclease P protein component [Clostridia bacterium]